MGGGDLNLKKSWHPSTLRNIERVWKAEQKHEVEKQKIEQLQKELAEERAREEIQAYAEDQGVVKKREERLDWMYQGPAAMVNREEYLLGRKIDKTLEMLDHHENGTEPKKDEFDIGSTMFSSQDLSGTATVDLANKIREDPLFSIMKKEKEQRKNLLCNPVKMKQLQQMLQESLNKGKKKKSKKSKNHSDSDTEEKRSHKKHKKHKHHRSNSSDSEQEKTSSKMFLQDYHRKTVKLSEDEDINERRRSSSSHPSKYHHKNSRDKEHYSSKFVNDKHGNHSLKGNSNSYHRTLKGSDSETSENEDKNERYRGSYSHQSKNHKSTREKEHYSSNYVDNNYESHSSKGNSNSRDRIKQSSEYKDRNSDHMGKRKIDEEERERRLREMQENAEWREKQRKRNVKRYKEEEEKEASENNTHKVDASDFIKPMLSKAAGKGSVENRVKQKIFSIQRSSADMDKNFVRR